MPFVPTYIAGLKNSIIKTSEKGNYKRVKYLSNNEIKIGDKS